MNATALLLLLALPAAAAAAPFEGVLEGRMTGPHATGTTRALVSQEGLRTEMEVETPAARASGTGKVRAVSLYRSAEPDRVYVLDPERRTYRVDRAAPAAAAGRRWKVERKGRGQVAGLACDRAVLTAPDGDRIDVCVSKEIGQGARWREALREGDSGVGAGSTRALAAAGLSGYPLRWSLEAKGGASALTLEVTSAERRAVPASTFAIPEGWAEVPAAKP